MATSSPPLHSASVLHKLVFLVMWNLANTLPWLAMGALYRYVFPVGIVAWIFACLFVGVAQWAVLRRYISGLNQWALATLVGGIIGYAGFSAYIFAFFVAPLACGLAVGVAQWFVLRHKLTGAFWWIIATVVGAIVGLALGYMMPSILALPGSNEIEQTIFTIGIGIEIGSSLVTGCAMLWLLKRNANRKSVS